MRRIVTHREQAEMLSPWTIRVGLCPPGDPSCDSQQAQGKPNETLPQGGKPEVNTERGLGPIKPNPFGEPRSNAAPASSATPSSSGPSGPTPSTSDGSYGLPAGTSVSAGGQGFPQWVYDLGKQYGLTPSTYPGHQETNRPDIGAAPNPSNLNRGIDWTGSPQAMNNFAQHLIDTGQAEMVIHQDPSTGKTYGYPNYVDYSGNYGEEQGMVHTRFSQPPGRTADVNTPAPQTVTGPTTTPTGQPINPASVPTWGVGGIHNPYNTGTGTIPIPSSSNGGPSSPGPSGPSSTGPSSPTSHPSGSSVQDYQNYAKSQLAQYGWGPQEFDALKTLWEHESSWDPTAHNPSGAHGIPQFMPYTQPYYNAAGNDPYSQIDQGLKYIKERYKSPSGAWAQYYDHPGGEGSY